MWKFKPINIQQGNLSLQKFWFYIQTTMHTMEVLSSVVSSIHDVVLSLFSIFIYPLSLFGQLGDIKKFKLHSSWITIQCFSYFTTYWICNIMPYIV